MIATVASTDQETAASGSDQSDDDVTEEQVQQRKERKQKRDKQNVERAKAKSSRRTNAFVALGKGLLGELQLAFRRVKCVGYYINDCFCKPQMPTCALRPV